MSYYTGEPITRGPVELRRPDLEGFQETRAHADVEVSDWYERAAADDSLVYFAVALAADHTPIGEVMLHGIDREAGRAHLHVHIFHAESRHHDLGEHALKAAVDYAFRQQKLRELRLNLAETNFAARRCYAKCGFQVVDHLDEDESQLVMSLTREAWRQMLEDEEW